MVGVLESTNRIDEQMVKLLYNSHELYNSISELPEKFENESKDIEGTSHAVVLLVCNVR